ncbi:hypothetical protein PENTCL1PPCAC_8562, partial [Pristionchus entomophagus]
QLPPPRFDILENLLVRFVLPIIRRPLDPSAVVANNVGMIEFCHCANFSKSLVDDFLFRFDCDSLDGVFPIIKTVRRFKYASAEPISQNAFNLELFRKPENKTDFSPLPTCSM